MMPAIEVSETIDRPADDLHAGLAAATLRPGRTASADLVVRGLMREFGRGSGPARTTVLATREVVDAYRDLATGPVSLWTLPERAAGGRMARASALVAALARYERGLPGDIDVIHYPITVPIPRVRAPSVVTVHDLVHHDRPHALPRSMRLYRRFAYDSGARSATLVAADSQYGKSRIVERLGVAPEKVEVIHLGVEEDYRPESPDDDERLLGRLALPKHFVLYPATYWHHKNHERLIEAVASLRDSDIGLVLTGDPYGRQGELVERSRRLGLEGRVMHLGHIERNVMPALYRRATALVFPSLYEGFGVPPLEAMASGCPVACSSRASLPEVCGDAALYFDAEDSQAIGVAVERIVSDRTLRDELRAAGLRRAARFTWSATAAAYVALYRKAKALSAS